MLTCKYCGVEIKKNRTCRHCEKLKHTHPEAFGWVLSVDLETVTIDRFLGRRVTPNEIYQTIKIDEQPEQIASIISFGCAGLFNIVSGEKLYFDENFILHESYPDSFAIHVSEDLDNILFYTYRFLRDRYHKYGTSDVNFPIALAWHNGNSYDLSFFKNTEFYSYIKWENCCGSNAHDLKILSLDVVNGLKIKVIDTLKLFSKPLAKLGDEIGLNKLDGSSTYEAAPIPPEKPTVEQLTYCFRDIDVVGTALIKYAKIDGWTKIHDIPYTATGRVRNAVHNNDTINIKANDAQRIFHMKYGNKVVDYTRKGTSKGNIKIASFSKKDYKNFYTNNSTEAINNVMMCYEGGICYYNFNELGKVWDNVESWDFSSHYPSCMLMGDYPIWAWKFYSNNITEPDTKNCRYPFENPVKDWVYKHFYELSRKAQNFELLTDTDGLFCCAEVYITGLKAKSWNGQMFPYIKENSKNATSLVNEFYGGNIVSGIYSGYLTDLGFATLTMAYDYDTLRIDSVAICDKSNFKQLKGFKNNLAVLNNIDPIFTTSIAEFAKNKTYYKNLEKESKHKNGADHPDTVNYKMLKQIAKACLNGLYGNTAQNKLNYPIISLVDDEPAVINKGVWLKENWKEYDKFKIGFKNLINYAKTIDGWKELKSNTCELNQRWIAEYVTGWARYYLVYFATFITSNSLGTILYCDTDSIKVHWNNELCKNEFLKQKELFRQTYESKVKTNPLICGLGLWDNVKDLGNFDFEYTYDEFVTFGNKRYFSRIGNNTEVTFAGFSRKDIGESGNVVQYDVNACGGTLKAFVKQSGVNYHIDCNAEDNRKLDKCRHNEGIDYVLNNGQVTSIGLTLCPNKFSTTDITVFLDDTRVSDMMKSNKTYTLGTLAKAAGIYPNDNIFKIDREGRTELLDGNCTTFVDFG